MEGTLIPLPQPSNHLMETEEERSERASKEKGAQRRNTEENKHSDTEKQEILKRKRKPLCLENKTGKNSILKNMTRYWVKKASEKRWETASLCSSIKAHLL